MNELLSVAAVVTAGQSAEEDNPLAEYTQAKSKALIPIAGKPMITYVVDALAESRYIQHIVVVALDPAAEVQFAAPVDYLPDAGGLLANTEAGIRHAQTHYPDIEAVLLSGCDVPTITPAIVDDFIEECFRTDHDLYYSIVERSVMEMRFPGSNRSYVHLRDGDFAGGDIMLFRTNTAFSQRDLWQRLSKARKNALRQASMLGTGIFLKLLTRRLTIAQAEQHAYKVFNLCGRAVPFCAEVGMDVDKPHQLEIVRAELEGRAANISLS
jgi:CTP:molybdopterin cytidylyltransferase MocA